jgi:hypothetical protein
MIYANPLKSLYQEELFQITPKVLVIISKPWSALNNDEVILLGKILHAVKLSLAKVQIMTRIEFSVDDFKIYRPTYLIAFGARCKDSAEMYENLSINEASIVVAHDIDQLDDARKKRLWQTLKQVFQS